MSSVMRNNNPRSLVYLARGLLSLSSVLTRPYWVFENPNHVLERQRLISQTKCINRVMNSATGRLDAAEAD